jgi:hypothetical protein
MTLMFSRIWKGLDDFYFQPASLRRMAWFRIIFGSFALLQVIALFPEWYSFYGNYGWVEWVVSKEIFSKPFVPHLWPVAQFFEKLSIGEPAVTHGVGILYGLTLLVMTLGWRPRLFAALAWFLHLITCNSGPQHGYGVESFTHVALFYLIFFPTGHYYSLDRRRKKKTGAEAPPEESAYAGACFRLLQIHLCIVYAASGLAKMMGSDWMTGIAMWEVLAPPTYGGDFYANLFANAAWLGVALSWLVLALEVLYPIMIWVPRARVLWLVATVLMHVGIGICMQLYLFATIMVLLNLVAFGGLLTPYFKRFRFAKPRQAAPAI